jgi:hypothetical protein
MKRFLVFVIICIVTLSIGLTTYYFWRDNETIVVLDSYFEVNVNQTFRVDIDHINPHPKTEIEFESLHPEIVIYNPVNRRFEAISGGRAVIRVSATRTDFRPVTIEVVVGDGTVNAPFFIKSIEDLLFIGKDEIYSEAGTPSVNPMQFDHAYKLKNDLDFSQLTNLNADEMQNNNISSSVYEQGTWMPLGNNNTSGEAFSGTFDFNDRTIYNMNIQSQDLIQGDTITNAGLFSVLEPQAVVKNLNLENVNIQGEFENAGSIAGLNYGTVERSRVLSGNITNLNNNSNTGGVVGRQTVKADIVPRTSLVYSGLSVTGGSNVAGMVGHNHGGIIINSHSDSTVEANVNNIAGGIVGTNEYKLIGIENYEAVVKDIYYHGEINSDTTQQGAIIGQNINRDDQLYLNTILGSYYSKEISGDIPGIGGTTNQELDEQIGIYNKTYNELTEQNTYYSYTDLQDADIYWSFSIIWEIDSNENNSLPVLNMDAPKVDDGLRNVDDGVSIINVTQLADIEMDGVYVIRENLDLSLSASDWIPLGLDEPFTGKLSVDIDPATGERYIISNLNITTSREYNGLFAKIGSEGVLEGINLADVKITAGHNVGAIAGTNNGLIKDSNVINDELLTNHYITAKNTGGEANVGAIAGVSSGTITNTYSKLAIDIQSSEDYISNGGGLVGRNTSSAHILNSNSSSNITASGSYRVYAGGISGANQGNIDTTYFTGDITAPTQTEVAFVGGISGIHGNEGEIIYSYVAYGSYQGFAVGGLVGVSRGLVQESYADVVNIKAMYAGGLAFNIAKGEFVNTSTQAFLSGINSDSVKAGFAYFIEYQSDNSYGEVINSFSAATFDNEGTNYAETAAPVRTEGFLVPRQAGYITDSIFDAQHQILKSQNFVSLFNAEFVIPKEEREKEVTTNHATGIDGENFSAFHSAGFSTSVWSFEIGQYPQLRNAPELAQ